MTFVDATQEYEAWLGRHLELVKEDLKVKHEQMRQAMFPFFRATYYRWAQRWAKVCDGLTEAPAVLAVGDLHVENFGTWRDAEGRLIWGVNDFDEAWTLPYTSDLVRLASSAQVSALETQLRIGPYEAAEAIREGYEDSLKADGRPLVLAENNLDLRKMAVERLRDPGKFWRKLQDIPTWKGTVPKLAAKGLVRELPQRGLEYRIVHRVAGLGSLGRPRFTAIAEWNGGQIAREAKALAPSAAAWAEKVKGTPPILYQQMLERAVRCPDPFLRMQGHWIVRRLAPDCSRIELFDLPKASGEARLLYYMGWETANVHLGTRKAKKLLADLKKRKGKWLYEASDRMVKATKADWKEWRQASLQ